jgi:hypothetical protein
MDDARNALPVLSQLEEKQIYGSEDVVIDKEQDSPLEKPTSRLENAFDPDGHGDSDGHGRRIFLKGEPVIEASLRLRKRTQLWLNAF